MKKRANIIRISIGDKFHDWTAISEDYSETVESGQKISFVKVKCKCGYEKVSRKYSIQHGIIGMCRTCKKQEGYNNGLFKGYEDLGGFYVGQLREGASRRNLEFNVTPKELWELLVKQDFKCALSGLDIMTSRYINQKTLIQSASVDRINNRKGYTLSNIQWVHKYINQMKSSRTDQEFIELCNAVTQHNSK
jgi:hypothetical protein